MFSLDLERLATRREDRQHRTAREQHIHELRAHIHQMLAVVENDEGATLPDRVRDLVFCASASAQAQRRVAARDNVCDRGRHLLRI